MAFNWFRRQSTPLDPSTEQAKVSSESNIEETSPEESNPEDSIATEAEPDPEEDYLAWAKAAYQTVQERQQSPNTLEPNTLEIDTAEIASEIASEIEDKTEDIHAEEAVAVAVEPINPTQDSTPQASPTPPFSATPTPVQDTSPEDGFKWSVDVLTAQGRHPEEISSDEISWLQKLRKGLDKTRRGVVNQLKNIVGKGPLTQDAIAEIETLLIQADVGVEATDTIIEALQKKMLQETLPPDAAIAYLKTLLQEILDAPFQSKDGRTNNSRATYSQAFAPEKGTLNIWLMTGVNGAGKTTTIGKLAHIATESGFNCLVAAADTFRAAAVEQVKVWAKRSSVEVIANPGQNTDPASVVFDAITAAQSRNVDLLLVDTAGRLQNKKNLMDELKKVRQIIDRKAPHAKVESLLVLDATLGQNGLRQAQVFAEAAQLSGVVLTKLDGTAKGGVALAVVQQLGLPIRFIGAGEGIKDLRPFSSYEFVEALLSS